MPQRIEIDGSLGEGGGQILRTSLSLAAIYHKPIRIIKIRAGRKEPGLRPQHLQSVLVASKISGGVVEGASIGSTEIEFTPGSLPSRFADVVDTGTAGSVTLIAQTIIAISMFGRVELDVEIRGGTEVPSSPSIDYLSKLVIPVYHELGAKIDIDLVRRGYYPKGGGKIHLRSAQIRDPHPLDLSAKEEVPVSVLSVCRQLPQHVAIRQAESAKKILELQRRKVQDMELDATGDSLSPGSSVLVYERGLSRFVGGSSLGERGKRAELVGEEAAKNFLEEAKSDAGVDSHLADMLVTLLSCINGKSVFKAPSLTTHFLTNSEIAKKLTDCKIATRRSGDSWLVDIVGSPEKPN